MARFNSATAVMVLTAALLTSVAASAQSRVETLEWLHADPTGTAGYIVHVGTASRDYIFEVDVGVPPIVSSAYTVDIELTFSGPVYVAVVAYDSAGNRSPDSNEIVRGASDGGDDPDPPSDPGAARAAIVGFDLVDPTTGQILDGDFRSGDKIDVATQKCTSIDIVVNDYLAAWNQPGSVRTIFDGEELPCNAAPLSHENNKPFAWESESECADSLTVLGAHQLVAVPYDGDDCTGEAGEPMSVVFEVLDSAGGASEPDLGQPGRPFVIQ